MKKIAVALILLCILLSVGGIIFLDQKTSQQLITRTTPCIPTFVDGGGPYYKDNAPFRTSIAPDTHTGQELTVRGRVVSNDCQTPVVGAVLDIWHADETGEYQDEWYRGKVTTNDKGEFSFRTVIPKGYGEGTGYRPPHIHFKVWKGDTEIITSQMFFPESKGTPGFEDAYIMQMKDNEEATHTIVLPDIDAIRTF